MAKHAGHGFRTGFRGEALFLGPTEHRGLGSLVAGRGGRAVTGDIEQNPREYARLAHGVAADGERIRRLVQGDDVSAGFGSGSQRSSIRRAPRNRLEYHAALRLLMITSLAFLAA